MGTRKKLFDSNNPFKRQRKDVTLSDLEMSFEDETSPPKNNNNPLLNTLTELKKIEDPTPKQLLEAMIAMMQMQLGMNLKIDSMSKSMKSLESAISSNKTRIDTLEENFDDLEDLAIESKGAINLIKQKEIDNNVMISGFPNKPDATEAANKILENYEMNPNCIKYCYSYERSVENKKDKSVKTIGYLVITLNSKSDQINLQKKKKEKGLPVLKNIVANPPANQADSQLKMFNMLTSENISIQQDLRKLIEDNRIVEIKFRNCCFYIRIKEDSDLIAVSSSDNSNKLSSILKSKKK